MVKEAHTRDKPKRRRANRNTELQRWDLEGMRKGALTELCLARGIPTNPKLRKKDLIEMLVGR
jgi:hypothetical protein